MSKADEMFEELGYKKQEYINTVYYENEKNEEIIIDKDERFIVKQCYLPNMNINEAREISFKELAAINEKCRELGWIREEKE